MTTPDATKAIVVPEDPKWIAGEGDDAIEITFRGGRLVNTRFNLSTDDSIEIWMPYRLHDISLSVARQLAHNLMAAADAAEQEKEQDK